MGGRGLYASCAYTRGAQQPKAFGNERGTTTTTKAKTDILPSIMFVEVIVWGTHDVAPLAQVEVIVVIFVVPGIVVVSLTSEVEMDPEVKVTRLVRVAEV